VAPRELEIADKIDVSIVKNVLRCLKLQTDQMNAKGAKDTIEDAVSQERKKMLRISVLAADTSQNGEKVNADEDNGCEQIWQIVDQEFENVDKEDGSQVKIPEEVAKQVTNPDNNSNGEIVDNDSEEGTSITKEITNSKNQSPKPDSTEVTDSKQENATEMLESEDSTEVTDS